MDKIRITTTITLPDGRVLSQDEIDAIQAIVDGETPPVEKPKCEAGPTPQGVKVITDKQINVGWHGIGVTPVDWVVSDLLGNKNGEGRIVPKAEDVGRLILNLDSPMKSSPKYQVRLTGVECDGTGLLIFDNPFYTEEPGIKDCKAGPTPKTIRKKSDYILECDWHGDEVKKLNWLVTDDKGQVGGKGTISPIDGSLDLELDDVLKGSEKLTVILDGVSCKGSGTLIADNPFFGDDCCPAGMRIQSVTVNNKDNE